MPLLRPTGRALAPLLLSGLSTVLGLCLPITVSAVGISPVVVELSAARRVVSITITNPDDAPVTFQAATRSWRLEDGTDRYEDTEELLVVPAVAQIAARGTQIFRVTLRRPPVPEERAYRLIFEDISELPAGTEPEVGVQVRVNHDLPVFALAAGRPRPEARIMPCAATRPDAGCVRIVNDGTRYLVVRQLRVERGEWQIDLPTSVRVLAGAWRELNFELPAGTTGALRLTVTTPDGPVSGELTGP